MNDYSNHQNILQKINDDKNVSSFCLFKQKVESCFFF